MASLSSGTKMEFARCIQKELDLVCMISTTSAKSLNLALRMLELSDHERIPMLSPMIPNKAITKASFLEAAKFPHNSPNLSIFLSLFNLRKVTPKPAFPVSCMIRPVYFDLNHRLKATFTSCDFTTASWMSSDLPKIKSCVSF